MLASLLGGLGLSGPCKRCLFRLALANIQCAILSRLHVARSHSVRKFSGNSSLFFWSFAWRKNQRLSQTNCVASLLYHSCLLRTAQAWCKCRGTVIVHLLWERRADSREAFPKLRCTSPVPSWM